MTQHLHSPADVELLTQAVAGDSEAIATLFDRYEKRVLNVCWRVLQHREDAQDAAAVAFTELWRQRVVMAHEPYL